MTTIQLHKICTRGERRFAYYESYESMFLLPVEVSAELYEEILQQMRAAGLAKRPRQGQVSFRPNCIRGGLAEKLVNLRREACQAMNQ
ncbi:MAG: hypothetical protein L0346_34365 [Chloroflexi bacterium]|nr:hypothetical protein [Chloroflexota bacterium]